MTVDNYFLPVGNLDQAREFYHSALGLAVKFDFAASGMVAYRIGDDEPALILKDVAKFPDAKPTVWFVVDDVKSEHHRLADQGVRFLSEPFAIRTGWAVEFEDPFGNRLGLTDYAKP